jgi:geranylgeranyl reductase family protein
MKNEHYDAIIIGAGPAGLYTSWVLKKSGLKTIILEEHKEIGCPVQCSGLIPKPVENFFPRGFFSDLIENEINKSFITTPSGFRVEMLSKKPIAYVVNRGLFDKKISEIASAEIAFDTKAESIKNQEKILVKTDNGIFHSDVLIGCDGPNSIVARHFGSAPKEMLKGLIAITNEKNSSDFVDSWFDKKITDGFFWKIPRGETTEYGMLGKNADFAVLEKFFGIKNYEKRAGMIPIGPGKTYFNRAILIGDAAAQVKPWSGGGVHFGLTAATAAGQVLKKSFEQQNFTEAFLKQYETLWKKSIGKKIQTGLFARRVFKKMSNFELEIFFRMLSPVEWLGIFEH